MNRVDSSGALKSEQRVKSPAEGPAGPTWPLVLLFLFALTVLGWTYLAAMIADMVPAMDMTEAGPGMGLFNQFNLFDGLSAQARAALAALCLPSQVATFGMPSQSWTIVDVARVFLMWAMMTFAMMIPSIVPMVRTFLKRSTNNGKSVSRAQFGALLLVAGYVTVWLAYAVAVTALQWLLTLEGILTQMMAPVSLAFSASVLIAAGIYQLTPAKYACLQRCWYPRFNLAGPQTTFRSFHEGVIQGLACLGCCWAVMAVMFAVGLMNVIWVAILGVMIAVEKMIINNWIRYALGVFLLAWGAGLAALATGGVQL